MKNKNRSAWDSKQVGTIKPVPEINLFLDVTLMVCICCYSRFSFRDVIVGSFIFVLHFCK